MLSELSQVSKQSDAFASLSFLFLMSFWTRLTTLIIVLKYSIASTHSVEVIKKLGYLREPSNNLALFCLTSVITQATILESIS
jgi:hypothetical protein